jgi:LysM repeat protein
MLGAIVPLAGLCYDFTVEHPMRQVKRVSYIVLLNIIISAITVGVVLQLWENDHPPMSSGSTPVVIVVTATQPVSVPIDQDNPAVESLPSPEAGLLITGTLETTPALEMIAYRVKEGDFLGALAVEFNVNVADIMAVNNLADPNSLYIGQLLYIPSAPLPTVTKPSVPPTVIASATPRPSATVTLGPTATHTPTAIGQAAQIMIDKILGAGVLENERIVIRRSGNGELSLAGWRLTDNKGFEYLFPQLTLYEGGAINLNTRSGQDTVVDLFWDLTSPVWSSGKIISVYDQYNNLRATYSIP